MALQKSQYAIQGMHCASCARVIEKTLQKVAGVQSIAVNYGTETASLTFDDTAITPHTLSQKIKPLGYELVIPSQNDNPQHADQADQANHVNHAADDPNPDSTKATVLSAVPLALFSILVMVWDGLAQAGVLAEPAEAVSEFFHHVLPLMATYVLFVVGKPYLKGVWRFLRYGKANMDTLIGIGTSVAFLYSFIVQAFEESLWPYINVEHTYYDVTIVVITFIALGKFLEARAKRKTGDALRALIGLQAKTALVIRGGTEREVALSEVVHGDLIRIKPGSKIPVDGVVTEGSSYIDESMITGEPMPVEKSKDGTVRAGTMNTTGTFIFRATGVGAETLLAHIIRLVSEAQSSKAPIQALADRISGVFVPVVLALAFLTLGVWLFIGSYYVGFSQALSFGLTAFVGILVIACPCALGLATPTAIIVGVGKGARSGILIKDATTLETLYKAHTLVFDKTGTITKGKPELTDVIPATGFTKKRLLSVITSLEHGSEHPIAHAITTYTQKHAIPAVRVTKFSSIKGKGIRGTIGKMTYFAGNVKLMQEQGIPMSVALLKRTNSPGKTPVIVATQEQVMGVVLVADTVKVGAAAAMQGLRKLGVHTVMLTGDTAATANAIARSVGIETVEAEVLPDEKLAHIKKLQKQYGLIAMAGDGINDAPALAQADIGIAMGTGTDVAIETAGITLLHGDISKVVQAFRLSRLTMRGIKQNLFWAFVYNIVGIPIAAGVLFPFFGWMLSPAIAGLAMALSSVSVVANSLRLKGVRL